MSKKISLNTIAFFGYFILIIFANMSIGRSYLGIYSAVLFSIFFLMDPKIHKSILRTPYIIFLIYALIISGISALNGTLLNTQYIWSDLISLYILEFFCVLILIKRIDIIELLYSIQKVSWILLLLGIIEEFTRINLTSFLGNVYVTSYLVNSGRILSIFSHPLGYAVFLTMLFCINLYFPFYQDIKKITYYIMVLLNIAFTQSRTAMLTIILIVIVRMLKRNKYVERKKGFSVNQLIYVGIIILFAIAILFIFRNQFSVLSASLVKRITDMFSRYDQGIRLGVVANYYIYIHQIPWWQVTFGRGVGASSAFMEQFPIHYWSGDTLMQWSETTDNTYISLLLNYGLVGTFLFIINIIFALRTLFKYEDAMIEMAALCLMGIFLQIYFLEGLNWPVIMFFFAFFYGILLKQLREKKFRVFHFSRVMH